MTQDRTAVRKQVMVDAPIERAFAVFTDRFGDFKPPEHSMLGAPVAKTVFEPWVGGQIVDQTAEHRHLDRHGPGWKAVIDGVDGPEGWPLYLDRYAALLKEDR